MAQITLVGCSRDKLDYESLAGTLYTSERFLLAKCVAQELPGDWYIISGLHGLVHPEERLEPYDFSLSDLPPNQLAAWAKSTTDQLKRLSPKLDRALILASKEYSIPLAHELTQRHVKVVAPLENLSDKSARRWLRERISSSDRAKHLEELYSHLSLLQTSQPSTYSFRDFLKAVPIPSRGLYLFFEFDQQRLTSPEAMRIVRVGTHAVSRESKSTLRGRLRSHLGATSGSGSHRSSVMRLHIGKSMVARDRTDSIFPYWGVGQNATPMIRESEAALESRVSDFIGEMRLNVLAIADHPSHRSDRAYLEQNIIGLLSGSGGPLDVADKKWLGSWCPNDAVRRSSLWNVNYVDSSYDPNFLPILRQYVDATIGRASVPTESIAPSHWHEQRHGKESPDQLKLF